MSAKRTKKRARAVSKARPKRARIIRYRNLENMKPSPLSERFRRMSDAEVERRAAADPDAGIIPPGFWDKAQVFYGEPKQQITLRLDADVVRWFKRTGKGYQSRMGAVLKSYVEAQRKKAG